MKTLTAGAAIPAGSPAASVQLLAKIEFTAPSALTLYVSDVAVTVSGQEYLPLVASWGTIEESLNTFDAGGRPATAQFSLYNTIAVGGKSRLSDLLRTPLNTAGTYEFANAKVTFYYLFSGLITAGGITDAVNMGVLYLEDPTEVDQDRMTLRMSDQSLLIDDKMNLLRVNKVDFPNADPDDVGKTIPVAIGSLLNVPIRAIVAGAASNLSAASVVGATTLQVSDTSAFPAVPFTVQVQLGTGSEQRTCTAKTATTLSVSSGFSSAHGIGATVFELRSGAKAYRYVVCENKGNYKTKGVNRVFVHDGIATTAYTVDLDDTTLVAGRSFVVINFSAVPTISSVVVTSSDTIGVNSPSFSTINRAGTNTPITITSNGGAVSGTITVDLTGVSSVTSVLRSLNYSVTGVTSLPLAATWNIRRDSASGQILESGTGSTPPQFGPRSFSWGSGASAGNQVVVVTVSGGGGITIQCTSLVEAIEGQVVVNKTGTVTVSGNSSADVIFGNVTCDLDGIKDDGGGTIGAGANVLIENPTDVVKLALLGLFPGTVAADVGASFATSRALHAAGGYKWAGLLGFDDLPKFQDLRRQFEEQGRARLFLDNGNWQWKYRVAGPATADITFDYTKDVWDQMPVRPSRSPRSQLANSIWIYSQRDYTKTGGLGDMYAGSKNFKDLTQPGFTDPVQRELELTLVRDAATADALGAYWLSFWKRQRWETEHVSWQNAVHLDKVDYFAVSGHPVLAAHGDVALIFEITGKRYRIGDDQRARIELHGLEANA